ncbi:hypothetical protein QQG55_39430 [Brugia pahangi]
MQQMYAVRPYLNFHENMRPSDVMYPVKNYHAVLRTSGGVKFAMEESLREIINRNQLKLVEQLTAFIDDLNKALVNCSPSSVKIKTTFKESKAIPSVLQQQFAFRKSKVSTLSKEEIGACCSPTLTVFKTVKYPTSTITLVGDIEQLWLKNLAKVTMGTSIRFEGLNDGISAPRCTVKLQPSSNKKFVAEINGTKVSEYISVWKLLGALTSLYPTASEHADICTHMDYWLQLIDDVLLNRRSENNLCRQMSIALSHHDYLVPNVAATLVDVLAYSFIRKQSYYSNNVELWLLRMDKLFCRCNRTSNFVVDLI